MEVQIKFNRLKTYNLFMGFLHLVQALLIFSFSKSFTLPITSSFLNFDTSTQTLVSETKTILNLPFGPMVSLFLLISAAAHFLIASPGIFNRYVNNLKKGINKARWYEYSLSASVMIVLIAMLCGLYDIAGLIMAFALTAVMNLCGLIMEVENQNATKTSWISYIVGCIAGVLPWVAIGIYFFGSLSTGEGTVPTFVYFILPTLFVFFFSFALNMFLQYKKVGPWKNYIFGEQIYVLLSLLAKSALAWQVFAGTLRP